MHISNALNAADWHGTMMIFRWIGSAVWIGFWNSPWRSRPVFSRVHMSFCIYRGVLVDVSLWENSWTNFRCQNGNSQKGKPKRALNFYCRKVGIGRGRTDQRDRSREVILGRKHDESHHFGIRKPCPWGLWIMSSECVRVLWNCDFLGYPFVARSSPDQSFACFSWTASKFWATMMLKLEWSLSSAKDTLDTMANGTMLSELIVHCIVYLRPLRQCWSWSFDRSLSHPSNA